MIRYTITAIKKDGFRQLAFDNNAKNDYEKREDAEKMLANVLKNNSPERIKNDVGESLEIRPVKCYPSGDSTQQFFNQ